MERNRLSRGRGGDSTTQQEQQEEEGDALDEPAPETTDDVGPSPEAGPTTPPTDQSDAPGESQSGQPADSDGTSSDPELNTVGPGGELEQGQMSTDPEPSASENRTVGPGAPSPDAQSSGSTTPPATPSTEPADQASQEQRREQPEDTGEAPSPSNSVDVQQGVESRDDAVGRQAQELEQQAIEQTPGVDDASNVRVLRDGDNLRAELTAEGRRRAAAAQFSQQLGPSFDRDDVQLSGDGATLTDGAINRLVAFRSGERQAGTATTRQRGTDVGFQLSNPVTGVLPGPQTTPEGELDPGQQTSGTPASDEPMRAPQGRIVGENPGEATVTALEQQAEETTGVDLERGEDFRIRGDIQEGFRAVLTEQGRERLPEDRQRPASQNEASVLDDVLGRPPGPIAEDFTVADATELTSEALVQGIADENLTQQTGRATRQRVPDDLASRPASRLPEIAGRQAANRPVETAAALAPVAAAEPGPFGEITVGGVLLIGGIAATGAAVSSAVRGSESDAPEDSTPPARQSELTVAEEQVPFGGSEVTVDGREEPFSPEELGLPEETFPSEATVSREDVVTEDGELDVPEESTVTIRAAQAQQQQEGEEEAEEDDEEDEEEEEEEEEESERVVVEVPREMLPDDTVTIGDEPTDRTTDTSDTNAELEEEAEQEQTGDRQQQREISRDTFVDDDDTRAARDERESFSDSVSTPDEVLAVDESTSLFDAELAQRGSQEPIPPAATRDREAVDDIAVGDNAVAPDEAVASDTATDVDQVAQQNQLQVTVEPIQFQSTSPNLNEQRQQPDDAFVNNTVTDNINTEFGDDGGGGGGGRVRRRDRNPDDNDEGDARRRLNLLENRVLDLPDFPQYESDADDTDGLLDGGDVL